MPEIKKRVSAKERLAQDAEEKIQAFMSMEIEEKDRMGVPLSDVIASEMQEMKAKRDEIQEVYDEIYEYSIELDRNPYNQTMESLQEKIYLARAYKNRVFPLKVKWTREQSDVSEHVETQELYFELTVKELVMKDENLAGLLSVSAQERESLSKVKFPQHVTRIQMWKKFERELKTLVKMLDTKQWDLKDVISEIDSQIKIIGHQISLNYGDLKHRSMDINDDAPTSPVGSTLDSLQL